MADTLATLRIPSFDTLTLIKTRPTKIMPDTDKDLPTAEVGDEYYGNENDEADPPEDPSEQLTQELPRLIYANRNPRSPCPICRPYVGTVWQLGCQPRVPRHGHCYCYYQEVWVYETKNKNRFPIDPLNQAHMDAKLL